MEKVVLTVPRLARFRRDARRIFRTAIYSIEPKVLIRKNLRILNHDLHFRIRDTPDVYETNHNVFVCGFGKAVAPMATQIQEIFGKHIERGIISVPTGFQEMVEEKNRNWIPEYPIKIIEGAENNIPDSNSLAATHEIISMIANLKETDILITLISGGGSALCPLPKEPLTLERKREIIKVLSGRGASIRELNKTRIRLSAIKGGKLLDYTKARVVSLILSDIVDSPIELIASGPTVKTVTSAEEVLGILEKYHIEIDDTLRGIITEDELPDQNRPRAADCHNHIIGSNITALKSAKDTALALNYEVIIATDSLTGEAREVGRKIAAISKGDFSILTTEARGKLERLIEGTDVCLLFGGETTVNVKGDGKGGRNQEMALSAALELQDCNCDAVFLSVGTDGQDGPTDAAGAVVDHETVKTFKESYGVEPEEFLANNDSYNYFKHDYYAHLKTGHTGTNVMDVQVLLFNKS